MGLFEATKLWSGAAKRPLRRMASVDTIANPTRLDIVRQIVTDGVERIADLAAEARHCSDRAQRDQPSHQCVLNEILAGFILCKRNKHALQTIGHFTSPVVLNWPLAEIGCVANS